MQQFECVVCDKGFKAGDWVCADGSAKHIVKLKRYLLADAPSDPGHPVPGYVQMDSRRDGRTIICNVPPQKQILMNGEPTIVPGGSVEFVRGIYETTDPEIQYHLDKKGGFCTEAQWRTAWLSPNQNLELDKQQLAADRQRLENERNELLTLQQQAKSKQREHASAR